ncbi:hypothetical protein T05_14930 [Trichinella murrelli]|uniref:Uncharacterized protein n=1 Tax=Trichinella murrelli TaxID=144512 RepID=A0A0V0TW65_9BILA|nr:hypothetical protein T05_14930 [Trichinella murrelli]KRX43293.1 hypothetical protein T05_14930 [Trichinella murrelli]
MDDMQRFENLRTRKRKLFLLHSVEQYFWNLTTLNAGTVRAFGGALELKSDIVHLNLGHAFLSEIAQLVSFQNHAGSVVDVGVDLDWLFKKYRKHPGTAVRHEHGVQLSQYLTAALQFQPDRIFGGVVARTVKAKAGYEDSTVSAKLYTVASTPVTPLIVAVGTGLEPMAPFQRQPKPLTRGKQKRRLLFGKEVQNNIHHLFGTENAGQNDQVGKIFDLHRRKADHVENVTQHEALICRCWAFHLPVAFRFCPTHGRFENLRLASVQRITTQYRLQRLFVNFQKTVRKQRHLCLRINHVPASETTTSDQQTNKQTNNFIQHAPFYQFLFFKQSTLRKQKADILRR